MSAIIDFYYRKASFILILFLLLLFSCQKDPSQIEFEIGSDLIQTVASISICDTFSIQLSTVQTDSIVTSGLNNFLVGKLTDKRFGTLNSKCYFRISLPSAISIIESDIYDSISLVVKLNGYSYGDTTIKQNWIVHRLAEEMKTNDDGYLYNSSSFKYIPETLGNIRFKAYPSLKQEVEIPLNSSFGETLFNLIIDKDEKVESNTNFYESFKGFAIESVGNELNTLLGINTKDSSIIMRMYAHRDGDERKYLEMDFDMETEALPFSQISYDRSNTLLNGLLNQKEIISSTLTNNEVYMQGGSGLLTRVEIPGLAKVLEIEHAVLMKAELILKPVLGTYRNDQLPTKLIFKKCDKLNRIVNYYLNPTTNEYLYGSLFVNDILYNENTNYTIDITEYIKDELADNYFEPGTSALLISYNEPDFNSTASSIVLGDGNNKQKAILKLYFLYYE